MDELVERLNSSPNQLSESSAISTLAFADDLVLVSESLPEIRVRAISGVEYQPWKVTRSVSIRSQKQLCILTEPLLTFTGSELPVLGPVGSAFKLRQMLECLRVIILPQ